MLGLAVVVPADAEEVTLVARYDDAGQGGVYEPVLFTDDGSIALDLRDDGEWWAVLTPRPGTSTVRIEGTIDGRPVDHAEDIAIPAAWNSTTYPATFLATPGPDGAWRLQRLLMGSLPVVEGRPTGAGLAGTAEQLGLPPALLYLAWGLLFLGVGVTAAVRAAVVRARRELDGYGEPPPASAASTSSGVGTR